MMFFGFLITDIPPGMEKVIRRQAELFVVRVQTLGAKIEEGVFNLNHEDQDAGEGE